MSTSPTAGSRRPSAQAASRPRQAILVPGQRGAPPGERVGRRPRRSSSRPWVWLLIVALALGAVWLGQGTGTDSGVDRVPVVAGVAPRASVPAARPMTPPSPSVPGVRVRYEVLGRSPAGVVTYTTRATGPVSEATGVRLPWSREFAADGGFVPSLSAQGAGPISCRITVDGLELSSVTTSGGDSGSDAVATCTGHALH